MSNHNCIECKHYQISYSYCSTCVYANHISDNFLPKRKEELDVVECTTCGKKYNPRQYYSDRMQTINAKGFCSYSCLIRRIYDLTNIYYVNQVTAAASIISKTHDLIELALT